MTNEESALGSTRRAPRQGMGGSPVGSWLTVALAVVAVVIGFLILRNITNDDSAAGSDRATPEDVDSTTPETVISVDVPVTDATTTTTEPQRTTEGATVLVANANTVGGSAGTMTKALEAAGYTTTDPVDASGPNIAESIVYFDAGQAGAEDVANSVARDIGGVDVLELPNPAPTESGNIGDAGVLVMLGDDQAGKTLEELSPPDDEGTTEAPDPAAGDTATTAAGGDADAEE